MSFLSIKYEDTPVIAKMWSSNLLMFRGTALATASCLYVPMNQW